LNQPPVLRVVQGERDGRECHSDEGADAIALAVGVAAFARRSLAIRDTL